VRSARCRSRWWQDRCVALVLLLGEGLGGGIDVECRFGGVDHRLLHLELGALARDRGFGGGHVGLGLVKRHPEIAIIDFCEHLAGRDALVVADQHVTQVAGDFWRDGGVVGLHIGVVGRNQETADGPVIPAVPAGGSQDDGCSAREQDLLEPAATCLRLKRRGGCLYGLRQQLLHLVGRDLAFGLERLGMLAHGALLSAYPFAKP